MTQPYQFQLVARETKRPGQPPPDLIVVGTFNDLGAVAQFAAEFEAHLTPYAVVPDLPEAMEAYPNWDYLYYTKDEFRDSVRHRVSL